MQNFLKLLVVVMVSGTVVAQASEKDTLADNIELMARKSIFPNILPFAKENIIGKTFRFTDSQEYDQLPIGFRNENAVPHSKFFLRIDSLLGDENSGVTHFTGVISQSSRGGEKKISGAWNCSGYGENTYFTIELNESVNMELLGAARSGFLGVTKNLRLQLVVNRKALLENQVAQVNLGQPPTMHTFWVKQDVSHDLL